MGDWLDGVVGDTIGDTILLVGDIIGDVGDLMGLVGVITGDLTGAKDLADD